ncbi:MAG: valine--tRNA ligase [Verrucomicrobiota bacterium]
MAEIPKSYDPQSVEDRLYAEWLKDGCFQGAPEEEGKSYTIMIPPPNVTGVLTMGHVLNNTIQDILIRRNRQLGRSALWLPGTDHAGIATQTRVERELRAKGMTRHDLGRRKFVEKAIDWRDRHGGIILQQLKKLGASCDWERTVHTLDSDYSEAVIQAFVSLHERGMIYRGKRMVNWCPVSLTALSDEEVIMKPQKSKLYYMRYELVDSPGEFLEIATTRPETIMGDSGIAVHPEDSRYNHLIGKRAWRPFPRKEIPIVGDKSIDREFGTGVLKVTPAHDPLDFEIGERNGLEVIDVFTPDGRLNDLAGDPFVGLDRFEARKVAAERLKELDLLIREDDYENNVGFSERADVPIEPRLSEQWFLKYPKVEEAKAAVREGLIRFYPKRWEKTYLHWMDNIRDWCISRQLWWGHRIPVWYRKGEDRANSENWHISVEGPEDAENWEQDEDVLDTWASSWLWPLATLGWPDESAMKKKGFAAFYPTSALVTGPDIIFFWVARMIMAGLEFAGDEKENLSIEEIEARIPFKDVYFTGIIRDLDGRKMSKSLGNSPDPLDLIDKFGADGLRFGIMSIAPQGQDIRFGEQRVVLGRNFCNKLWNACRFRQISGTVEPVYEITDLLQRIDPEKMDLQDHSILGRLLDTIRLVDEAYEAYSFSGITQQIYAFFWSDFCDWYVEVSKDKVRDESVRDTCLGVQDLILRQTLLLLHPFCPFITEELWRLLGFGGKRSHLQDQRPISSDDLEDLFERNGLSLDRNAVAQVDEIREAVTILRSLKADYQLSNRRDVRLSVEESTLHLDFSTGEVFAVIESVGGFADIETVSEPASSGPAVVTPLGTFHLDLSSSMDIEAEKERLSMELVKLDKVILGSEKRLENQAFLEKAPESVIEGAKRQLEENERKRAEVERLLESFS